MVAHSSEEIFHPKSIAVVGASSNPSMDSYGYILHLLDHGYKGKIYPVNPKYTEIQGIKAYPGLKDIPEPVDYVISCVSTAGVLGLLDECPQKEVKVVHIYTGRFSETARPEDVKLEKEVLNRARQLGVRIIGPNSMGLYYPREGIAYGYDFPKEPGKVGFASQSGGGSLYFIQLASLKGIRFSKVISFGNALDLNECDFLDYFAQDEETEIILLYIEGVKDGRRFYNSLRHAASTKPTIVIKGGKGASGARVAASHTASLAGSTKIWDTVISQSGCVQAKNFEEMVDLTASFYFLPEFVGNRVGIVGTGGGLSVLSADQCEEVGLDVVPLPLEIREEIKKRNIPLWDWIGNPVDSSIASVFINGFEILKMMDKNDKFDILFGIINEDSPLRKEDVINKLKADVSGYIEVKEK